MHSARLSRLALAAGAALAVAVLTAFTAHHDGFPPSPKRLVTDDLLSTDVMLSLGRKPVAAAGFADSGPWPAPLAPFSRGIERLGSQRASDNLDALTSESPDAIVAPVALKPFDSQLQAIAPTIYDDTRAAPQPSKSAGTDSTWKTWFHGIADQIGLRTKADTVIARLDVRAAAIRGLVAGKTVAAIRITGATSFVSGGDDVPLQAVLEQDLGLKNFTFKPQMFPYGCSQAPTPPKACPTNTLGSGIIGMMRAVSALLVQTGAAPAPSVAGFERSSQYRTLPAVRSRHVVHVTSFDDLGPLGVGYLYSTVDRAFGLEEYAATLTGSTTVALVLAPSSRRLCWALGAPSGSPASIRLVPAGGRTIALATAPAFSTRGTTRLAEGCLRVSAATAKGLSNAHVEIGSVRAALGQTS